MYEYKVKEILSVYDGDTITVALDLGFGITKIEKLKFALIKVPEIGGDEHDAGVISRDWLRERLDKGMENTNIIVRVYRRDKYDRYIAEFFIDNMSINKQIINEGYATAY